MKKSLKHLALIGGIVLFTLTNCSKNDDDKSGVTPTTPTNPMTEKVMLGESNIDAAEITVKLYSNENPFVGYNNLYVMLYRKGSNEIVKNARVKLKPMMDMGMMEHSCPIENPVETQPSDGIYEGAAIFIMESAGMGDWRIEVEVDNLDNEQSGQTSFDVEVVSKTESKVFSFISETDGSPLFVTLIEPSMPEVGLNDFEVAIHKRENMNSFPPVDNVVIKLEPEMPTMGHGSPDNVNPTYTEMGHYLGTVNFTMPGYWKVNLNFKDTDGNVLKNDQYFDITF